MTVSAGSRDNRLGRSGQLEGQNWSSIPLRLGLIGTAMVIFQSSASLWIQSGTFWQPANLASSALAWTFSIACLLLAVMNRVPRRATWLVLVGLVGSLWISAFLQWRTTTPFTTWHPDNEMIGEYAAEALKHGYNPYSWNFSDAARVYRDQGVLYTYFLDGSSQNRVTYPALPTLLLVVFGRLGLGQARFISLVFHTILLTLLFFGTPARFRPLFALALFATRDFIYLTFTGIQDIVWSTLLVAMLLTWERPTLRAVLFGLACAYRQQPWVLAPFLLIHIWNTEGYGIERRSRIFRFIAVSLTTFLVINLQFILWDARGWVLGVFEPAYAAFNVASHGLGALTQYNLLPLPRSFFTFLQLSTLGLMLIVHWRHPHQVGASFWLFPAVFFWLFYRGLANYWLYWIPPLLFALTRYNWSEMPAIKSGTLWRQTLYFIALILGANLLMALYFIGQPAPISARLIYPHQSTDRYRVYQLSLKVANDSDQTFHPRFALQHDGTVPLPWEIQAGPDVLEPGQAARYVIETYSHPFFISNGAQVVISDGGGDYALRAVTDISADRTFSSPDLIRNPSFTVWLSTEAAPAGWSWEPPDEKASPLRTEMVGQEAALVMSVEQGSARLSQLVTFPDSFSILVYPTASGSDASDSGYGMELDDGRHQLRILFGDRDERGRLEQNVGYVVLRTVLNQWSNQEIHPAELYASFGWELPPYTIRNSQGLEFYAPQVRLSLLVYGEKATGIFGPIEQDPRFTSPEALVSAAIEHPDVYYVNLADEYRRQRNADLAENAYRQAIAYNNANAYAHNGLSQVLADAGRCLEAEQQHEIATLLAPGLQDRFEEIPSCR